MKFKSASSNPRVKSLNPRVTSSNPWVTGSNPRVASSNPPTIKSMNMQVNSFKSSLLHIIISPKFFHNSHLYVQFLVIISCFTFPLLHGNFLAGGDALVYLAKPVHKKYSTKLFWGNLFSAYVSYDWFFNSSPPLRACTHLWWPPRHSPSYIRT